MDLGPRRRADSMNHSERYTCTVSYENLEPLLRRQKFNYDPTCFCQLREGLRQLGSSAPSDPQLVQHYWVRAAEE